MTLTQKLTVFIQSLEDRGFEPSTMTGINILMMYYNTLDVNQDTTFYEFSFMVRDKTLPAYESVTRAIRKARELTPRWRKAEERVVAEIERTREEVGYDER